jgi:hypothetical protein
LPPSSGIAHSTLLMPGVRWLTGMGEVAYARTPMGMRIPNLAVARISAIYGKCDWMNVIARAQSG